MPHPRRYSRPTAFPRTSERSPARQCLVEGKSAPALGPNFGWRGWALGPGFVAAVEDRLGAAGLRPAGDVVSHRPPPPLSVGNRTDALGVDSPPNQARTPGPCRP